jgi:acyl-CoA hydrolase
MTIAAVLSSKGSAVETVAADSSVTEGLFTFVALDANHRPREVGEG